MRRLLYLLLPLLVSLPLQAEIYKGVDAEGNVTFSDKETPDSKAIPMPSPNTVKMPEAIPAEQAADAGSDNVNYSSFKIMQPAYNATLRENTGTVSVSLELKPDLNIEAGHTITIQLNGKSAIKGLTALTAELPNVSRGSHGVRALVKNKNDKTLIVSKKIIFHLKRQSDKPVIKQGPDDPGYKPGPQDPTYKPGTQDPTYRPGPNDPAFKPGPQNPAFKPGPTITPVTP